MNGHSPGSAPQPMLGRQVLTEMLRRAKYRAHDGEANRAEAAARLRIETQEEDKSGSSHGSLSTICSRVCLPYPREVSAIYKGFMPYYTGVGR